MMVKYAYLKPAKRKVLEEIRESPGISYGYANRKVRIALFLQKLGLVTWDYELSGWKAVESDEDVA